MKEITKVNADVLHKDLLKTLDEFGNKHGIKLSGGTFRYNAGSFVIKVEGNVLKNSADASKPAYEIKANQAFQTYQLMYGLKPEHLNKTVIIKNQPHQFIGLNPRKKYSFMFKPVNAARYEWLNVDKTMALNLLNK